LVYRFRSIRIRIRIDICVPPCCRGNKKGTCSREELIRSRPAVPVPKYGSVPAQNTLNFPRFGTFRFLLGPVRFPANDVRNRSGQDCPFNLYVADLTGNHSGAETTQTNEPLRGWHHCCEGKKRFAQARYMNVADPKSRHLFIRRGGKVKFVENVIATVSNEEITKARFRC